MKISSKYIRRTASWMLPLIILYFVFRNIDFYNLANELYKTDVFLAVIGISIIPITIAVGSLRWNVSLRCYTQRKISINNTLKHYWIGLGLGYFLPSSIGWDIYRVVWSGNKYGKYFINIGIIFIEKFAALITAVLVVITLYQFLSFDKISPTLEYIINTSYFLFLSGVLFAILLVLVKHNDFVKIAAVKIENLIINVSKTVATKINSNIEGELTRIPLQVLFAPLTTPRYVGLLLFLSFLMLFVSAIANQLFFQALNYQIPFIVNLFVVPILYFIFMLPISFGGLGIREGSYILLYSLFGVPLEVALIVSLLASIGILLNTAIGGVLIFFRKEKNGKPIRV